VKAFGDLDLALLVGASRAEAFQLQIRAKKSLAIVVDLGLAQKAVTSINETLNASGTNNPLASVTASGKIEWKLEKNGTQVFTLSYSVLNAISWSSTGQDGVARIASLEASNPTVSLHVDGPGHKGNFQANFGKAEYRGILKDLGNQLATGPLVATLAGFTGNLIIEDSKPVVLENLGLGNSTSSVTYSGKEIFSADFNKDLGRTVTLTANTVARGWSIAANKNMSVDVNVNLESIEREPMTTLAPEFKNLKYTGTFSAPSGVPTVEFIAPTQNVGGALKITNGTLNLSVNEPSVAPRSFPAPVCLTSGSSVKNAFVEGLATRPCP
jgi:hypothetical protein